MKTHAIILAACVFAVQVSLQAADVTGRWKSEFETQIGHLKYGYDLKLDGDKVTGKAIRELDGTKTEITLEEGKLTGDTISFVEKLKIQEQEIRIDYSGKVSADEMKLTRKVGDFATTEITAKRETALPVEEAPGITGKWCAEFDTQIGKQKYVYDFKAENGKLTGRANGDIVGEKSDTEIVDGKINGAEIAFTENVKFQGAEVKVMYTGKVAGDELKMTRKVGDVATEEVLAKRVKDSGK